MHVAFIVRSLTPAPELIEWVPNTSGAPGRASVDPQIQASEKEIRVLSRRMYAYACMPVYFFFHMLADPACTGCNNGGPTPVCLPCDIGRKADIYNAYDWQQTRVGGSSATQITFFLECAREVNCTPPLVPLLSVVLLPYRYPLALPTLPPFPPSVTDAATRLGRASDMLSSERV